MKQLLQELADSKLIKVTGSYADNSQNKNSDIDFYIKPDKPDVDFNKRNILKVISILQKHSIFLDSTIVGYVFTHKKDDPNLPIELEFSDLFKPRKNKVKEVSIFGVTFKTY